MRSYSRVLVHSVAVILTLAITRCSTSPTEAQTASPSGASAPQLTQPHHPVFSLYDNRLLAHWIRNDGLFIPAGHPGIAKYLTFGRPWRTWQLNVKEDGKAVIVANRGVSWMQFPLPGQMAKATQLSFSLKSPVDQQLRLSLNDKPLPPIKLTRGWQQVSTAIAPGVGKNGENRLTFTWGATGTLQAGKGSAAIEWIHVGSGFSADVTKPVALFNGNGLLLSKNSGVSYYVHPYRGAKLRLKFAAQPAAQRCGVKVVATAATQPSVVELRRDDAKESGVVDTFIDLTRIADRVAHLAITGDGSQCQELLVSDASIVMPGHAPKVTRTPAPKNVLFWLIDNARADRYRAYNPDTRVQTPVIDQLVKNGTVFTRAYIAGTESRVSHASIWTGLYPKQHAFIDPKATLASSWITMPEGAQKANLYTAAWVANGWINKRWGFGEGWNYLRNTLHDGGGLAAEDLAKHAIEFLGKHGDKPFFLYLGTIDVHVSWRGRQPWLNQYHPEPYSGPFEKVVWGKDVEKMAGGSRPVSPADKKRILAIYDSTVSYNDAQLGRVIEAIKQKGELDQTMIVITADHGEELWEYGRIGHGHTARHPLVAVPLIIHYPPLFGRGVRVTEGVDVLSVMPTILDTLGVAIPSNVQGESLLPLAQGQGRGYPRPSMATQYELAHTIRLENFKMTVGGKGDGLLYDLNSAAAERDDISSKTPFATRFLTDALSTFLIYQTQWRSTRWGVASNHSAQFAADLERGTAPPPIRP